MLLSVTFVVLVLPVVLSYDRTATLRNRRNMLLFHPHHQRRNAPFVIRVPYSKVVPSNSLFSHSVAWRAKLPPAKTSEVEGQQQKQVQDPQNEPEITQFHSQDTTGQVMFGFNAPDQMRLETRNADGTVHGTYSYLDPHGQIIKRQYWDTGSGFHVTSNTYPVDGAPEVQNQPEVQYTPEVQAARDLHFQLYQQALASLLPHPGSPDSSHKNHSIETSSTSPSTTLTTNPTHKTSVNESKIVETTESIQEEPDSDVDYERNENTIEPTAQNGSIIIENPEYLRISWITENKKFRINLYNGTNSHNSANKVQIKHELPDGYNITKVSGHRRSPK